jgi:hypothetical protein
MCDCIDHIRLGPHKETPEEQLVRAKKLADILIKATRALENTKMHYRNGREAKNGDKIIQLGVDGRPTHFGVLVDAVADNDYCNGILVPLHGPVGACLIDCLHIEDVQEFIKEKNLDKRPTGK